jgi:hypothetical protein
MDNDNRYNTPPAIKNRIEAVSPTNAERMIKTDPIRAKYFNKLRTSSQLNIGGRKNHKTISNKNKKKHKKLSRQRRHHSKKNRKSMKRK